MKHSLRITLILLCFFILAQIFGSYTITKYENVNKTQEGNITIITITHPPTAIGPQPEIEQKNLSWITLSIAIFVGTVILLLLIRFRLRRFWKLWFLVAVWMSMAITLGVYIHLKIALAFALLLALFKVFKPNPILHNLTEILVYTGIVIIILPFLNLASASALLFIISLYDMYAVWKSKHMIKMAKFQTASKLFAGFMIGYKKEKTGKTVIAKAPKAYRGKTRIAILGGGDIAFPLIFSAVVIEYLIMRDMAKMTAFLQSLIISLTSGLALLFLFIKGQKDKFYPAMPFISIGCFIGLGIIWLINFL